MIAVEPADPRTPAAAALLGASHALMARLFPAEANYAANSEALRGPDVYFVTARRGLAVLGCGAVALRTGYGELKSIYVEEASRGQGIADAILRALEDHARAAGLPLLKLETGIGLDAAQKLYARHGFKLCGAFGDYPDHKSSIFMEKSL